MDDHRKRFPVRAGNLVVLDGSPGQGVLAGIAGSLVKDPERLEQAKNYFLETLRSNGRPDAGLEITYGMALHDLLRGTGCMLFAAPFYTESGRPIIVEAHGNEVYGWWCVAEDRVLLRVRFDGGGDLTATQVACALQASPTPAPELVAWLEVSVPASFGLADIPENLRKYLANCFSAGAREFLVRVELDVTFKNQFYWYERPCLAAL